VLLIGTSASRSVSRGPPQPSLVKLNLYRIPHLRLRSNFSTRKLVRRTAVSHSQACASTPSFALMRRCFALFCHDCSQSHRYRAISSMNHMCPYAPFLSGLAVRLSRICEQKPAGFRFSHEYFVANSFILLSGSSKTPFTPFHLARHLC